MTFELTVNEATPGMRLRVMNWAGYQAGLVHRVRPFEGTYVRNAWGWEPDLVPPEGIRYEDWHGGHVALPELVEREFGELVFICDNDMVKAQWEQKIVGALRSRVITTAEAEAEFRHRMETKWSPTPYPGAPRAESIAPIDLMGDKAPAGYREKKSKGLEQYRRSE